VDNSIIYNVEGDNSLSSGLQLQTAESMLKIHISFISGIVVVVILW